MGRAGALKNHLDITWMPLDEMTSRRQLCSLLSSDVSNAKKVTNAAWGISKNFLRAWRRVSLKSKTIEQLLERKCFIKR